MSWHTQFSYTSNNAPGMRQHSFDVCRCLNQMLWVFSVLATGRVWACRASATVRCARHFVIFSRGRATSARPLLIFTSARAPFSTSTFNLYQCPAHLSTSTFNLYQCPAQTSTSTLNLHLWSREQMHYFRTTANESQTQIQGRCPRHRP